MNYNPVILALDYNNTHEAEAILARVRPHIGMIKIGLELFTACGISCLNLARIHNIPVFLDLKLHDVPTTVRKTTEVLCGELSTVYGQHFLSFHCFGGREMLKEGASVCLSTNVRPVGITMLTSMDEHTVASFGFRDSRLGTKTVQLGRVATSCIEEGRSASPPWVQPPYPAIPSSGLEALVCPPAQLALMRKHLGSQITLITPGIRTDDLPGDDHYSAKPASFALKNGANWLVIGRPITQAADPVAAALYFQKVAEKY